MTEPNDPPRLVDPNSLATPRIRSLIEESERDVATDAELAALEARLTPMLGPPAHTGSVGTGAAKVAAGSSVPTATAIKGGLAVLAVVAVGATWIARSSSTRTETPPVPAVSASATARIPVSPSPSASAEVPSPVPESTEGPSGVAVTPPTKPKATTESVSEADLLGQAQAALASNPARALMLAEKHRHQFPHGVLVQEREVIAIAALSRLGRVDQAKTRADAFFKAFPGSAYRSKVENSVTPK